MSPNPSILMFCPQFRPTVGGAERQVEKLAAALARSGCEVRVLTPRRDPDSPDLEHSDGVTIERFALDDLSRRIRIPGIGLLNIPYILWQVARAVRPRLRGMQVLHCHIASLETAGAALFGRMHGVPVICKAAMADDRSDLGEIEKGAFSGRVVSRLVRAIVQTWVATTQAVNDALIRAGVAPERIVCIPNGVELPGVELRAALSVDPIASTRNPAEPQRGEHIHRFLYVGRLAANIDRDVPGLIHAFDRLAAIYPAIELAVVGGGDRLEETRKLAQRCDARARIHLPGFDRPDGWFAWADCFVLPSRREGLSNALLEAMASELPCIANDIPPNREVLDGGNVGLLVPVGDRDALVAAMRGLLDDGAQARQLAVRARQRAHSVYAIDGVAERYVQLYRSLLLH